MLKLIQSHWLLDWLLVSKWIQLLDPLLALAALVILILGTTDVRLLLKFLVHQSPAAVLLNVQLIT